MWLRKKTRGLDVTGLFCKLQVLQSSAQTIIFPCKVDFAGWKPAPLCRGKQRLTCFPLSLQTTLLQQMFTMQRHNFGAAILELWFERSPVAGRYLSYSLSHCGHTFSPHLWLAVNRSRQTLRAKCHPLFPWLDLSEGLHVSGVHT